jgi:hypothetical protein
MRSVALVHNAFLTAARAKRVSNAAKLLGNQPRALGVTP